MKNFFRNKQGNVGVIFAISLVPMMTASGMAIDFTRAATLKAEMQKAADATALAVVLGVYNRRTVDPTTTFNSEFQPGVDYANLTVHGTWTVPGKIYRVVTAARAPTTFMSLIVPSVAVGATTSAELMTGVKINPVTTMMEPEAADYNELRFYCYKPPGGGILSGQRLGPIDRTTGTRVSPVKFADNSPAGLQAGLSLNPQSLEKYECGQGETVSYQMHNIRDARTLSNPYSKPLTSQYDYYTDTTESNGQVAFHTNPGNLIETIYCSTKEKCSTPVSAGGLIPDRRTNRNPAVNTAVCTNGFMYMGWEDRTTDSDRDYDDIRIVMQCSDRDSANQMKARIVE